MGRKHRSGAKKTVSKPVKFKTVERAEGIYTSREGKQGPPISPESTGRESSPEASSLFLNQQDSTAWCRGWRSSQDNMGPNAGAATRWVLSKIPQDSGKPEATPFSRTTKHYSAFSPLPLHTHRCGLAPAGFEPQLVDMRPGRGYGDILPVVDGGERDSRSGPVASWLALPGEAPSTCNKIKTHCKSFHFTLWENFYHPSPPPSPASPIYLTPQPSSGLSAAQPTLCWILIRGFSKCRF